MRSLPKDYERSWTLARPVLKEGIGLHSGQNSFVRLLPYHQSGFYVSFTTSSTPPIALNVGQIRESQLCTTLELGVSRLSTVEHLLAALAGCGLTHVLIEVSGNEIPLLDGSALGWVEGISEAGLVPAPSPRKTFAPLEKSLVISRGDSVITATPSDKFSLVGIIDFPYPIIGRQVLAIDITPTSFVSAIAPARTFGFVDQLEKLKGAGLIKGGSLDNALVCDGDQWLNPPLRFEDEPVRHKLLDLIGDLALVGFPKAQILVYKGSHGLHADLASALLQENF